MALKTFVKVSAVNNLSDARYCAGMGVDVIGFSLDPASSDFVSEAAFKEITGWLSGVKFAGELGSLGVEEAREALTRYSVQYLQTQRTDLIPPLASLGVPLILSTDFAENNQSSLRQICEDNRSYVEFFLLESENAVLTEIEMSFLRRLATKNPLLLGFGFSSTNIDFMLEELPVKGIALNGSHEIRPGFKDFDELAEILEVLEVEENE